MVTVGVRRWLIHSDYACPHKDIENKRCVCRTCVMLLSVSISRWSSPQPKHKEVKPGCATTPKHRQMLTPPPPPREEGVKDQTMKSETHTHTCHHVLKSD